MKYKVGDTVYLKGKIRSIHPEGTNPYEVDLGYFPEVDYICEKEEKLFSEPKPQTPKVVQAFEKSGLLHVLYDNGELWVLADKYMMHDQEYVTKRWEHSPMLLHEPTYIGSEWIKLKLPHEEEEKE